jgi:hypothetical protein
MPIVAEHNRFSDKVRALHADGAGRPAVTALSGKPGKQAQTAPGDRLSAHHPRAKATCDSRQKRTTA